MDLLSDIPIALLMIGLGLAFRPLHWMAGVGGIGLIVCTIELFARALDLFLAIWPYLIMIVLLFIGFVIFDLWRARNMTQETLTIPSSWKASFGGLREKQRLAEALERASESEPKRSKTKTDNP